MIDACVAHGVRCWVATTLKWWVFGVFTVDYSRCVVSPIIRRNQKECTVLQCLVTWMRIALEAEESDYSTPERKAERRQQRHAARISNDNRPPLQRIPIHSTSLRTTCTTRNAPEGSRRSRRRSIPQPESPRPRSASSSRSQRRRGERMREGRAADANDREQYQDSCHCTHTHTHTHITYVNTLYVQPVQFVSAVVAVPQNHPSFPPQW
ncbi:hypothetical protein CC85DRAFT_289183 [Cutaneotrichosporon oleaginosum]|uniref:Uncharacterized protein n=1 Tax=Cutaneotrichosporon oleaginosum TaxID=879819 RepID=A0A0J0XCM8_9TREE|nr:uncharacterized protein CC85DRAFT_289183 [Cutaneotrichosporon oleaginosum]KLT38812.1 hypothetical protein CC85DRAFT_289183 [Cutaneotrichosporon oleaginosum]TXT06206.1 hypothetical protein COLE_05537 [Cutaneotrichosporon oleaginosum]